MGKPSGGSTDLATVVATGTFGATGVSGSVLVNAGNFNFTVWGTFVAAVALERSFDGGVTWLNCSIDPSGSANLVSAPASMTCKEPESGVLYRVNCSSWTSGTPNWRISQ